MFYLIIRPLAILLFKILFRLRVFGIENIPLRGGFILASNHTSYLDPPLLGAASPRILSFLAKEELFHIHGYFFARLISNLNTFPLKTKDGDLRAIRWAIGKLEAGGGLVLFPEGGRTPDGEIIEPFPGVGLLAVKAGVSIIPAFIKGSNKALPMDSKFIRPAKIEVYFGKAIWPGELITRLEKKDVYQTIAMETMERVKQLKSTANNT